MLKNSILVTLICGCFCTEWPGDLKKCKFNDTSCITDVAKIIISKYRSGIPGVNLESMDPILIDKIDVVQGKGQPINLDLHLTNCKIYGISKAAKISHRGLTSNPSRITLKAVIPSMQIISDYQGGATILLLPAQGNGRSNLTLENADITIKFAGKIENRNGKEYYQVNKIKLDLSTKRLRIRFENLFNGNRDLGETFNSFINENWKEIYTEIYPVIRQQLQNKVLTIVNDFFTKNPYRELFI